MDEFTIGIALWDGVEELDFAGPYEVLDRLGADGSDETDQRAHVARDAPTPYAARTA